MKDNHLFFVCFIIICMGATGNSSFAEHNDLRMTESLLADSLFQEAKKHRDAMDWRSMQKCYRGAADLFKKDENLAKTAICLLELSILDSRNGRFDRAVQRIDSTRQFIDAIQPKDEIIAYQQYAGAVLLFFKADYSGAIKKIKKALKYFEKENPKYKADLLRCYNAMGVCYVNTAEFERAIHVLKKGLDIDKSGTQNAGNIHNSIGLAYQKLGDFDRALEHFKYALHYYSSSKSPSQMPPIIYNNIGIIYGSKMDYKKAIKYFEQSLAFYQRLPEQFQFRKSNTLHNTAQALLLIGRYTAALEYIKKCIDLTIKTHGMSHPLMGDAYILLGNIYSEQQSFAEAKYWLNSAQKIIFENYGARHPNHALIDLILARTEHSQGNRLKALSIIQKALIRNSKTFNSDDLYDNPKFGDVFSYEYYTKCLNTKANFLLQHPTLENKIKKYKMALSTLEHAIGSRKELFYKLKAEDSKLVFSDLLDKTYKMAIFTAIKLYQLTQDPLYKKMGFTFAEQNKAMILQNSMRDYQAKHFSQIPDSVIENESQLRNKLVMYESQLYRAYLAGSARDSSTIIALENDIFQLKNRHWDLVQTLEEKYPEYKALKYRDNVVDIQSVKDFLEDDQALVEFAMGDSFVVAFVFTNQSFDYYFTEIDSHFTQKLLSVISCFKQSPRLERVCRDKDLYLKLADIYASLFSPFKHIVENKRIVIIPDGILGYLPFDLLLTDNYDPERQLSHQPFLIKKNPLSYHYSTTLLVQPGIKREKSPDYFMALFAPSFENSKMSINNLKDIEITRGTDVTPLFGNKREVENIKNIIGGKSFIGENATEEIFKAKAPNYKILHVATHGMTDDDRPMLSKLIFTKKEKTKAELSSEDGHLNAFEIFNMSLNADLVVLSACETGTGKLQNGEGIMSLARVFLYAGVPSLVVSFWSVNDELSVPVFTEYYKNIKARQNKDEALRTAKLAFLKNSNNITDDPFYWAPFVLIGDSSPIFSYNYTHLFIGAVILFFSLVCVLYYLKKIR